MAIRKIINIDQSLCNGCGLCIGACHEAAIIIENGKARLLSDNYCDGLGNCLPACPTGAITFVEREAQAFDEGSVQSRLNHLKKLSSEEFSLPNWPVQIKLAPTHADYFNNARIVIAADCTAFAYAAFHKDFAKNNVILIGCPKLDGVDYSEKLANIIANNRIQSITVLKMEVPCCSGLAFAAEKALAISNKIVPIEIITISVKGKITV